MLQDEVELRLLHPVMNTNQRSIKKYIRILRQKSACEYCSKLKTPNEQNHILQYKELRSANFLVKLYWETL